MGNLLKQAESLLCLKDYGDTMYTSCETFAGLLRILSDSHITLF